MLAGLAGIEGKRLIRRMKAVSGILGAGLMAIMPVFFAAGAGIAVQAAFVSQAHATVVSSIEVRGNSRVESSTIRDYVNIKPGKSFSNTDIDEGIKRLFATGLFSDVKINVVGNKLVVVVSEYSIINQVLFQGNKKMKDAQLAAIVQLAPRGSFSRAKMEADAQAIREAYKRIGRSDAVVTPEVDDLGENRVNVVFKINEGGRTKITSINFTGNNFYSDRRLREIISTKESNLLSFLFRDDVYDADRLQADQEALRRFYYNHGFADFRIISAVANLDDTTNEYTINFTVDEGERYTFGKIGIESSVPAIDPKQLRSVLKTRQGQVYSAKAIEDSIVAITGRVADEGYAFAQVTPRGSRDFNNRTISVDYTIDEGPRTYIDKIIIRGNTRTRDYVIRREFDLAEGDAFNPVLVKRAKQRLEDLKFFTSVNVSTAPGPEPDQVELIVDVVEKPTGEFSIGAGYTTGTSTATQGVNLELSVTERNFLGRGQYIRAAAGGGLNSRDYTFSFTEPYFLGRRLAAGFDIYRNTRQYTNYNSVLTGGTVRFGLPITDNLKTLVAYNYSTQSYDYDNNVVGACPGNSPAPCPISQAIQDAVSVSPWIKSSVSGTLTYSTIDDENNPHEGLFTTSQLEYAGLGGDAKFVKITGRGSYYHTISETQDIVGVLSGGGGYVAPTDGPDGLRVFDLFQNSTNIIRGFKANGIGPYDPVNDEHLGGTTYINGTAEAQFPLPVIPENFGMKGALFADAATLFGNDLQSGLVGTDMQWRASIGAGIIWASPFGPLRVNYAYPIVKESTDDVQEFSFGVSTRF